MVNEDAATKLCRWVDVHSKHLAHAALQRTCKGGPKHGVRNGRQAMASLTAATLLPKNCSLLPDPDH